VLLLVHTPPLTPSLNGIVPFWQNDVAPAIGVGAATVMRNVVLPHWLVAVIVVVPPGPLEALDTTPVTGFTVATLLLLLVHVPVGAPLLLRVVVELKHITFEPVISVGAAETVTV
jgi:hypothetical protein